MAAGTGGVDGSGKDAYEQNLNFQSGYVVHGGEGTGNDRYATLNEVVKKKRKASKGRHRKNSGGVRDASILSQTLRHLNNYTSNTTI